MLAGDQLRASAERAPDRLALIGRGLRLTYAEFDRAANRLAHALIAAGLGKGARIAILAANSPQYAIAYFAIARTPYVSAHCSTRSNAAELAYVLNKVRADMLFFDAAFTDLVDAATVDVETQLRLVSLGGPVDDATRVADFVQNFPDDAPEYRPDESDALAITMSGGTTGLPKAVLVSHKARCASAIAAADQFGLTDQDIVAASTPLFHTAGLFVWFATAVMLGATVVLPERWDPVELMQLVEQERITAAFLVPSQLNSLVSHAEFSAQPLATLRNIGYAGAPMGRALQERIRAALPHVTFTENYGQSEACPITIRCEEHGEEKLATVGRQACNAEVAVVDRHGHLLPAGETGDIVTRGDQVFDGYLGDAEATAEAFRVGNGWLLTGDVGFLDEDGFLTLVDRSMDMLISGGENIYPTEIENALYQHDAVTECAVFGIPDEQWGEVPAAHVVLSPGAAASEDDLIGFCAERIASFKRPRLVKFVDSLPKTAVGKIRKNELRDAYWKGKRRNI